MGRFLINIEDIKNNIKYVDVFDLQVIGMPQVEQSKEDKKGILKYMTHINWGGFSESISNVGFGNDNDICITFYDFTNGETISTLTDELLSKGLRLVLADRDGTPVAIYEFSNCKLISDVPIILGYDNTYVIQRHPHILIFKYSNIYKVI